MTQEESTKNTILVDLEKSMTVVKRNGQIVPFHRDRIAKAIEGGLRDTKKVDAATPLSEEHQEIVNEISKKVTDKGLDSILRNRFTK